MDFHGSLRLEQNNSTNKNLLDTVAPDHIVQGNIQRVWRNNTLITEKVVFNLRTSEPN